MNKNILCDFANDKTAVQTVYLYIRTYIIQCAHYIHYQRADLFLFPVTLRRFTDKLVAIRVCIKILIWWLPCIRYVFWGKPTRFFITQSFYGPRINWNVDYYFFEYKFLKIFKILHRFCYEARALCWRLSIIADEIKFGK